MEGRREGGGFFG